MDADILTQHSLVQAIHKSWARVRTYQGDSHIVRLPALTGSQTFSLATLFDR